MGKVSYELHVSYSCWWLNWSWTYIFCSADVAIYTFLRKFLPLQNSGSKVCDKFCGLNRSEHFVADSLASSCRRTTGWGRRWSPQYFFLGNISLETSENVFFQNIQMTSSSENQVDRLAQDFSLASKEESLDAIDIGEKMLELMDRWGFMSLMMTRILTVGVIMTKISSWWRWWSSRQRTPWQSMSRQWWLFGRLGFSPSVTWPGYLRLTELLLKVNKRSFCDYRAIVDFISGGTSVKSSKVCGSVVPPGLPRKRQK